MTHGELIAIAHKGLLLGPSPLLPHNPQCRRAETDGVVMTSWGPFGPAVNKVAVVSAAPPLARILQLAQGFFGAESQGFGIVVEADAGHPIEAELGAARWKVFEDEPALVLPSIPAAPPSPAGLEVRPVRDTRGRADFVRVCIDGFGAPTAEGGAEFEPDAHDSLAPSVACALDPDVALLVGYVDGKPVSSALFYAVGPIAGITGVATVPAYRRRGLATALTGHAVHAGAARGCTSATLAALGASYDLYKKMGFIHVCNHRAYEPPAKGR